MYILFLYSMVVIDALKYRKYAHWLLNLVAKT